MPQTPSPASDDVLKTHIAAQPPTFFVLVFALSIPFWLAGAATDMDLMPGLPVAALAFVCPVTAALILQYRANKTAAVTALLERAFDFRRIGAKAWYAPTLLLMPGVCVLSYGLMRGMGVPLPTPHFSILTALGLFAAFFIAALGEELGWSGYVTDPMQDRLGTLQTGVLLGSVWAAWHLIALVQAHRPLAWIAWWCLATIATRVVMVWLYNNTGKSVFAAALFHTTGNVAWQLFPVRGSYYDPPTIALIMTCLAACVTTPWRPLGLARRGKTMIGIAFFLIAAVAVGTLFVRDLSHARARLVGRSQIVATSVGDMEYALLGHGDPVLVVHGAGGGFDQSLDMIGPLADDGYRLIAPSRFGYLRSPAPAHCTNAMQADAYADLLDRLGVTKVSVIAISAGAWSALQFAIRHPDRCQALALLVPAPSMPPQKNNASIAFVRAMFGSDFVAWATIKLMPIFPAAVTHMILGSDPAVVRAAEPSEQARTRQILDHLLPVSARTVGMALDIRSATISEPYALEKISCPVLAISAADDAFGTNARATVIAAGVPGARTLIYPTGGHALVGHDHDVRRAIVSFLGGPRTER